MSAASKPRVGVSACLLGRQVRFDGGHKKHDFVHDTLSRFVEFVPECPEQQSGMPVPRESMRLVTGPLGLRLLGNKSGHDSTDLMASYVSRRVTELAAADLDGFVLKKDSPSCGVARVRVYTEGENGPPARNGSGLFAAKLRDDLPFLPLAEEGWLLDNGLRECFLHRVFTHHRFRTAVLAKPSRRRLMDFHAAHKLLFMAHSPVKYRSLGRLVAGVADRDLEAGLHDYRVEAMAALGVRTTPGKHANVLQHIMGHFKEVLTAAEKEELLVVIDEFRTGIHGLVAPLTLLMHYLRRHDVGDWLESQVYFHPYPKALSPR